jgi:hypothetical protein
MFPFCSVPTRGAYRDRHGRGAECGGRGQRSRVGCDRRAGLSGLVSVSTARRRRRSLRTAKAVWSWHPLLMLSPAEAPSGPTGRAAPSIRGMTVAKRNSSPGRARRKLLKPLCREGRLIRHTCGDYRVLPTTARGPRVHRAPGLPCALVVCEGQRSRILRAIPAPRRCGRLLRRVKTEDGRSWLARIRQRERESDRYFGRVHGASSLDAAFRPW